MKKKQNEIISRRQFFKKSVYVALPMLGIMTSGCNSFQSALMDSLYNRGSGSGSGERRGYDGGSNNGCGNLCTTTCSSLCTDTCKGYCTNTCYHSSV